MANIRELRARFTANAQSMRQTLNGVQTDLERIGTNGATSANQANDGFKNLKSTLLGFAGAYLGFQAISTVVGGLITTVDQYQTSLNGLQAQTGATNEEMKGMEESLKNIYANNYGADFTDIADSMALVKTATGLSGKALEQTTQNAIMLRDTFQFDVAESTATADTMMKQFGITSDEAMTLIAQGAQNGLNKSGDLLASFDEYSVYFQQLGYDAEGMWDVYNSGIKAGVMNTDVIGDTIKEFGILAKDGSDSTREAFQGLSLDATKMEQAIAKGGPAAQKAMQQTFEALGKIQDPMKRNEIGVALFGGKFEDLEHKAVIALGSVKSQADMAGDTLKQIDAVKYNNIGAAFEGIKRAILVELLQPLQTNVMPFMNQFVNYLKTNMPQIKTFIVNAFTAAMNVINQLVPIAQNLWTIFQNIAPLIAGPLYVAFQALTNIIIPIIQYLTDIIAKFTSWEGFIPLIVGIGTALAVYNAKLIATKVGMMLLTNATKIMAVATRLLNVAMAMNPIGLVIALIAGLVAALVVAYQRSETFRNIVNTAWQMIKTTVAGVIEWFRTTIPIWINNIITWFKNMGNWISQTWNSIKTNIMTVWNSIISVVVPIVQKFVNSVVQKAKTMATNIMNLISPLITFFKNTWSNIKLMVLSIIGVFLNLITGNFEGLKVSLLGIWTAIKNQVINIITMLKNMAINLFTAWKNGMMIIINALKTAAIASWNALKAGAIASITALKNGAIALWDGLKSLVLNVISGIKNGVVNGFNSAKSSAISAWNALKNGVSNAIESVKTYVSNMKSNIISTIRGINLRQMGVDVIQGFINGIKSMVGSVGKAIKSVADNVTGKIKSALGINSPSRVFMQFGEWTGEGLGIGIEKMKNFVGKATQKLADASVGTINNAELNPIAVDDPKTTGSSGGSQYNAPLMHVERQYVNNDTDVRDISNGLYGLQRRSDRKKGR